MKVLYDHQIFSFQEYGGISEYFFRIISGVKKTGNKVLIDGKYSNNIFLPKLKKGVIKVFPKFKFPLKNVLLFYVNEFLGSDHIKRKDYDMLHATYYHPSLLNKLKGKPYVITVHDMIHELFPGECGRLQNQTIEFKKKTILKANHVIAGSENTRKDIMRLYSIPGNKISVVYYGSPFEGVKQKPIKGLPKNFILFVGNRNGYKNFELFVKAIAQIIKNERNLFLVCAGGGEFTAKEKLLLTGLGVMDRVRQVKCDDSRERAFIYTQAVIFVVPSLYEGFGLTGLEAFSMGCPVAASNTSSLPEVCGDAAMYFDPKNTASIKMAVQKVLGDARLRGQLRKNGFKQVRKFSWAKSVKQTLKVYEKVVRA